MNLAREGGTYIVIAALVAAGTFLLALNRRSWPIWLLAMLLTIIAICVAYVYRDPQRTGLRGPGAVIASLPLDDKVMVNIGDSTIAGSLAIAELAS